MTLIKRNRSNEVGFWRPPFPRIFDEFFRGDLMDDGSWFSAWTPAVDISENEDSYVFHAELPGMNKDDVKITLKDNVLTIKGEKKNEFEKKGSDFYAAERTFGSFERSFELPGAVKFEGIDAGYKDGILTITVPKAEESKPKAIEVKVN